MNAEPVGKARHRTTRTGHTYTPQRTTDAQEAVQAAFRTRAALEGFTPLDGAVRMDVYATFRMPKSWSAKKHAGMSGTPCLKKPDGDNVYKLVGDALNGLAYADDSQVSDGSFVKYWGADGSVVVSVESAS